MLKKRCYRHVFSRASISFGPIQWINIWLGLIGAGEALHFFAPLWSECWYSVVSSKYSRDFFGHGPRLMLARFARIRGGRNFIAYVVTNIYMTMKNRWTAGFMYTVPPEAAWVVRFRLAPWPMSLPFRCIFWFRSIAHFTGSQLRCRRRSPQSSP